MKLQNLRIKSLKDNIMPFPSQGVANGIAFSSTKPNYMPESLKIVFKELAQEYGIKTVSGLVKRSTDLTDWCDQGVLLLNRVLTVKKSKPSSHKNIGWELFTDKIIEILGNEDRLIVYALWGKEAQSLVSNINPKQAILKAPHPASEKYGKTSFIGCNHFTEINNILVNNNISPIKWI